jgi:hypothetical protein
VNDLFIAPEGSMQFEFKEFPGEFAWVEPEAKPYNENLICGCTHGHTVLAMPASLYATNQRKGTMALCACMGRIIE